MTITKRSAEQRRAELAATRAYEDDIVRSSNGIGETFGAIFERRLSRRGLIKSGVAAAGLVLAGPLSSKLDAAAQVQILTAPGIKFTPIAPTPVDSQQITIAEGYDWSVLLSWGDPIFKNAPAFDAANQSVEAQLQQFGYNCDYIGWLPLPHASRSSGRGLLWVNHEYTNEELMFAGYDPDNPTREQVEIAMAAHGGTVVEMWRGLDGRLGTQLDSPYNRRITANTPMHITGPAAEEPWMQTSADAYGRTAIGMLNNCAGGTTPWGTVLTCEENFHQYFGNLGGLDPEDPRYAVHERYGLPEEASERRWERFDARFDIANEPNEAFRFGWVVEVDPLNPQMTPIKHTALGRFRHEGATFGYSPSGRVVFYSGDDSQFEYIYKYVSDDAWTGLPRQAGPRLLDEGTLYVARFNDDGSGDWLPLRYGEGPLTEENAFTSQGDVLIKTRLAADALGATKMDRPEDVQQNPVNHKIYAALTNNTSRETDDTNLPNPRPDNSWGHVVEITEENDDAASEVFSWEIFILCGDPADESTYFAGFPKDQVSAIANPDNVNFDEAGNLWISTDGQPGSLDISDGLYAVPTDGPERGRVSQFLSNIAGGETASFEFCNETHNLVVSIQHPGEGGTVEEPVSTWPGAAVPRPSVIQIWKLDGGKINS